MSSEPTLYQILRSADSQKAEKDKVRVLKENSSKALKAVLGYALDPRVKWMLPEGVGPYTENQDRENHTRLNALVSKLPYFVDGPQMVKNQMKRENLFLNLLSDIDPADAILMVAVKEKKLPFESITREVVEKAFPNMTKDWPKPKEAKK